MRKYLLGVLLPFCLFLITGCGTKDSLSDETNDLIAQYAANQVLQNDPDYNERLGTEATTQESATTEEIQEATTETSSVLASDQENKGDNSTQVTTDSNSSSTDVSSLYSKHKLQVTYSGYKFAKRYNDGVQASADVEPVDGGQLFVVSFSIKNKSKKTNDVDLIDDGYTYSLHTDSGTYEPMLTICSGDLTLFQSTMQAKSKEKAVLIFEVPKTESKETTKTLDISNNTDTKTISIQ